MGSMNHLNKSCHVEVTLCRRWITHGRSCCCSSSRRRIPKIKSGQSSAIRKENTYFSHTKNRLTFWCFFLVHIHSVSEEFLVEGGVEFVLSEAAIWGLFISCSQLGEHFQVVSGLGGVVCLLETRVLYFVQFLEEHWLD